MKLIDFIIKFASQGDASVVNAASKIQGSIESAEQAADRLSTTVGGKLKQAFMSLPGAEFFTNPIVAMTAGIGTVSTLGMQAEKTAKSFDVLVGSQDKARKMLDEINDYADNTLWSRMDSSEAAQSLLAYGVLAEKVVKDLKMLGDISLGDKNKMSTLATVFGQISTAGRLMTQDYRQLLNVGFNPLYDISQMTGKSMAQLQDEMSKGTITFEMFEQAVIHATSEGGKYNNMIGSLASTTSGKFEQVKGAFIASLLEVYNLIQPLVSAVLSGLNSVFNGVKECHSSYIEPYSCNRRTGCGSRCIQHCTNDIQWYPERTEYYGGHSLYVAAVGGEGSVAAERGDECQSYRPRSGCHCSSCCRAHSGVEEV